MRFCLSGVAGGALGACPNVFSSCKHLCGEERVTQVHKQAQYTLRGLDLQGSCFLFKFPFISVSVCWV